MFRNKEEKIKKNGYLNMFKRKGEKNRNEDNWKKPLFHCTKWLNDLP